MKVFQGPHREVAEDITYSYNADFFLYASLHHEASPQARPNAQNGPPVLTGLPVSSMILLDRPEEAGYFIFSDLSVRHEGRYYLTFALMEEVKDDRDRDEDEAMCGTDEITGPDVGSGRHFQFRTTVQTDAFDVFSAKKFPGLQESTALSRTVAEQGCRVRIRRDVRMRRREGRGKGKDIAAAPGDEYAQQANGIAAAADRDRTLRNDSHGPYRPAEIQRRPSGPVEYHPNHPMQSFAAASPGGRQHSYGHMGQYPPHPVRSLPASPPYPPPPYVAQYPPRPHYGPPHTPIERSPPRDHGPPAPPYHPRDPRETYSYRGPDLVRGPPMLAPRLEPRLEPRLDPMLEPRPEHKEVRPEREPELHLRRLPSIHSLASMQKPVQELRRPLYPLARPVPNPPIQGNPDTVTLPPITTAYNIPKEVCLPPTPTTPSLSRKRSADEANLTSADGVRLVNGRRQEEYPRDANYKFQPSHHSQHDRRKEDVPRDASYRMDPRAPSRPYVVINGTPSHGIPNEPKVVNIDVHEKRVGPPVHWRISPDEYNRASDRDIKVAFPGLNEQQRELTSGSSP